MLASLFGPVAEIFKIYTNEGCTFNGFCFISKQLFVILFPAGIYLFNVNNKNTILICKICSKLTMKAPEQRQLT